MSLAFLTAARLLAVLALAVVVRAAIPWPLSRSDAGAPPPPRLAYTWALGIAAGLAVLLTLFSFASFDLPHGDWDAWSIWNLHARFLSHGGSWENTVSPIGFRSHPDYPLLLPALVAMFGHAGAIALAFAAAGAAALFVAVWRLRGLASAFLALLTLGASSGYLTQVPSQYADTPLSVLLLISIAGLLTGDWYTCGFAAAAAAFTKNEGIVAALALLVLAALFSGRDRFARIAAGAAPGLAVTAWFKLAYAPSSEYAGQSLAKLFDFSRWAAILGQIPGEVMNLGMGVGHPVIVIAILAAGLGFARPLRREWLLAAGVIGCQLLGYLGAYLLTPNALAWQLETSMSRLAAQVWPSILLLFFAALRPAALAEAPAESGSGDAKAERRKKKAPA